MKNQTEIEFEQLKQDYICLREDFTAYKNQRDKEIRYLFDENNTFFTMSFWERLKFAFTGEIKQPTKKKSN